MELLNTGWNIFLIILGFGLLIAIHELGHFLAARWAGIRVDGFAVGMGPVMLAFRKGIGVRARGTDAEIMRRHGKRAIDLSDAELLEHGIGETEYSLRWLPIGGFVKMVGQEDLKPTKASVTARSYGRCSVGKRMIVVSAGVVANVILAMVLFIIAFMVGVRVEAPVIGVVIPDRPAAHATLAPGFESAEVGDGLVAGDRVVSIDGKSVRSFSDLLIASAMSKPGDRLRIGVERVGHDRPLEFLATPSRDEMMGLRTIGVVPAASNRLSEDREVAAYVDAMLIRSGLDAAGVRPGMELVEVDGHPVHTWDEAEERFRAGEVSETVWQDDLGGRIRAPLTPSGLAPLAIAGPDGNVVEVTQGLLGFVPLTIATDIVADSPNRDLLQPGDIIVSVAGEQGPRSQSLRDRVSANPSTTLPITVLRGGPDGDEIEVRARVSRRGQIGVMLGSAEQSMEIAKAPDRLVNADGQVVASPAAALGLPPRTKIVGLDGAEVNDWLALRRAMLAATAAAHAVGEGATLSLGVILPNADPVESSVPLHLSAAEVAGLHALPWRSGIDAVVFDPMSTVLTANGNPFRAVAMGFRETHQLILLTYVTIDRLFRRSVGVDQLRGPVGIVHLGTRVVDRGWPHMLFFLGMISVNLAVLNFLPLPIVDGGLFLFLVYEKFKGEPPPVAFQNFATLIGLLLIGTLFVVTFYNDIARLVTGGV